MDASSEPAFAQERQSPAMVKMGVREDDRIESSRIEAHHLTILAVGGILPLEHSEIDQNSSGLSFKQIARSSHLARRAPKRDPHRLACLSVRISLRHKPVSRPGQEPLIPGSRLSS